MVTELAAQHSSFFRRNSVKAYFQNSPLTT